MTNQVNAIYVRNKSSNGKVSSKVNAGDGTVYYKDEGYSGKTNPNSLPALKVLLDDVKRGKVNKVIIKDPTRISRDNKNITRIVKLIKNNGTKLEMTTK